MAKLPYMQFYPADWILDTQVLNLEAKGAWIDILCQLWISETPGVHTWNMREFTTLLRLNYDEEIEQMVSDLSRVAEVTLTDDDDQEVKNAVDCTWITVKSRRIVRDWESIRARKETHKKYNDKRTTQKRQHNDMKTTPRSQKSEVRNQKSEEELREEKKRKTPLRATDDETWLTALKANPAYSHLSIDTELAKMDAWLSTRPGRQKTRKFIVNWLNKVEKPLQVNGTPAVRAAPIPPFPGPEDPIGRNLWRKAYGHLQRA